MIFQGTYDSCVCSSAQWVPAIAILDGYVPRNGWLFASACDYTAQATAPPKNVTGSSGLKLRPLYNASPEKGWLSGLVIAVMALFSLNV